MVTVDALFLYNEREENVSKIVQSLKSKGYETFYWRDDVAVGDSIDSGEMEHLKVARKIVVCLGKAGWGENHRRLFIESVKLNKEILPVLLDETSESDLADNDGFFLKHRYADFSKSFADGMVELEKALGPKNHIIPLQRFDDMLSTIIDGNEEQRFGVLEAIDRLTEPELGVFASRLRSEIRDRFSPEMENNYANAVRDTNKIPSVRSWMFSAMIRSDKEEPENKRLILQHLSPNFEHEENVRFWILAELFHQNASYIQEAFKITSKERDGLISMLREAIMDSKNPDLIKRFHYILETRDFENQWKVLRILRVIAIPELAGIVTKLFTETESDRVSYDALYALISPAMLESALPVLNENLGASGVLQRIITILKTSDKKTIKNFSAILLPFPASDVQAALRSAIDDLNTKDVTKSIERALNQLKGSIRERTNSIAGYTSDNQKNQKDYIDIEKDVKILTAVMLSNTITPPLAIGLFGDWGTGKSFFMNAMRNECARIQTDYAFVGSSPFHTNFVQIDFNAWNYSDSNLWASLVNHIFEQLSEHVTPRITELEQITSYQSKIATLETEITTVNDKGAALRTSRETKELELQKLEQDRIQKPVQINELSFEAFTKMLDDNQRSALNGSLEEMGLPAAHTAVVDLNDVLEDVTSTKGRFYALVLSIINSKNRNLWIGLLIVIIIGLPFLGWALKSMISDFVAGVSTFMIGFSATITTLTISLKAALKRVKSAITTVESARDRIETSLADLRKEPSAEEKRLSSEIAALVEKETEVTNDLSEKNTQITSLKNLLSEFRRQKSLATFLTDRSIAEDYKKHLGLMSVIRKDFDSLLEKLTNDPGQGKKVERIILYIDDLDRCPPEKVIEVLQAVHLLLAYELFVVVVGVDPIWLMKSIKSRYSANTRESANNEDQFLGSSPQNFLEKIFQIPFNLKPMSQSGFSHLLESLMSPQNVDPTENISETVIKQNSGFETAQSTSDQQLESIILNSGNTEINEEAKTQTPDRQDENQTVFEVAEEALTIQPWETEYATVLFAFIKSPRSTKRFANLYRILKAGVAGTEIDNFEGTKELPGDFQIPMVLLAIIIGNPLITPKDLNNFFGNANGKIIIMSENASKKLSADALRNLEVIIKSSSFPDNFSKVQTWLPQVCRFSLTNTEITK